MTAKKNQAVLVTTAHRGVFFGYANGTPLKRGVLTITRARNCLYWTAEVKGFLGLAAGGPLRGCRVGPEVPSLTLTDVTSVSAVTSEAEKRWNDAPWA